jgi:hypothetical protein
MRASAARESREWQAAQERFEAANRIGGTWMRMATLVFVSAAVLTLVTPAVAQILKTEPRMGALREGQVVLVDDGTCPAGQIKQVTGGNHVEVGGFKQVKRQRRCIPRR